MWYLIKKKKKKKKKKGRGGGEVGRRAFLLRVKTPGDNTLRLQLCGNRGNSTVNQGGWSRHLFLSFLFFSFKTQEGKRRDRIPGAMTTTMTTTKRPPTAAALALHFFFFLPPSLPLLSVCVLYYYYPPSNLPQRHTDGKTLYGLELIPAKVLIDQWIEARREALHCTALQVVAPGEIIIMQSKSTCVRACVNCCAFLSFFLSFNMVHPRDIMESGVYMIDVLLNKKQQQQRGGGGGGFFVQ